MQKLTEKDIVVGAYFVVNKESEITSRYYFGIVQIEKDHVKCVSLNVHLGMELMTEYDQEKFLYVMNLWREISPCTELEFYTAVRYNLQHTLHLQLDKIPKNLKETDYAFLKS